MLTVGGVECAFSLAIDQDRIPITLQVLEVELVTDDCCDTPVRVQVTLSDGIHFSSMTLARRLHHLGSELHQGDIVTLTNYISQRVKDDNVVIICLDITVIAASEGIIGNPSEFVSELQIINQPSVVSTAKDVINKSFSLVFCGECQQTPCDWSTFGPTIIEMVTSKISSIPSFNDAVINKQCRFAAYQMFTRTKLGYMGKGNRVQLPTCVSSGIKNHFPDPNKSYVGFIPQSNESDR
jgi:hypothetical protein